VTAAAVHRIAAHRAAAGAVPARVAVRPRDRTTAGATPPLSVFTTTDSNRKHSSVRLPVPGRKTRLPPRAKNALGGLVYLQDSKTKQKFLVDSGAAVSVLPHQARTPSSGPPLSELMANPYRHGVSSKEH
jgi:hypothetical protein